MHVGWPNNQMTSEEISAIRLENQQIKGTKFRKVQDLVEWMGAMQAQDFSMAKWAIGARLPDATDEMATEAFQKGEIVRTHLLRPTWHIVTSKDIHWILELTSPHIKPLLRLRHRDLELSELTINRSKSVIEKSLVGGKHLTREEIMLQLQSSGITTEGQRASHLMLICELDGLVCSGKPNGNKQTYTLLDEWVSKTSSISRDEALAELAKRYFRSHGPATIQDFIWWSGLPVKDAKNALEMVKSEFISTKIDERIFWFSESNSDSGGEKTKAYLLPAYDEFIISYRDRTDSLLAVDFKKAVSENGLFRPIIVVNGKVIGIWKRQQMKNQLLIIPEYFSRVTQNEQEQIDTASKQYGHFLNMKVELGNQIK
jgi:hypothetical protein